MPKYKNYTTPDIINAVATSKSIADVCRQLNLVPIGGNYRTIKLNIEKLKLSTSHFTGQAHNKGVYKSLENIHTNTYLKKALIRVRGHRCEDCGNTTWKGQPIPLEIEHIDGDNTNNVESNLLIFCPNCHSFTPTYRRKKSSLKKSK